MSGSMQQRGRNSWFFSVSCGYDKDGKRIRRTKTFKGNKREAQRALAEFEVTARNVNYLDPSKLTFRDFTQRWLRDYAERDLEPKTVHRYKELLESRIFPALGAIRISAISPGDIMQFYRQLQDEVKIVRGRERRLAPCTILHHHRLLSSILSDAVEWQVLPNNPAERVKPPKAPATETPVHNEVQTQAMLAALNDESVTYRTIVILALATGLRQGELIGLEWKDIDFDKSELSVRQAAGYIPKVGTYIKEPKTKNSRRVLALSDSILEFLRQYKAVKDKEQQELGNRWQDSSRVFTKWDGRPMSPIFMSKWFPNFLRRKNLPHMGFHGLRHLAATHMIAIGSPVKNVSAILGHARTSTTLDIYSHALRSIDREIARQMDSLFEPIKPIIDAQNK